MVSGLPDLQIYYVEDTEWSLQKRMKPLNIESAINIMESRCQQNRIILNTNKTVLMFGGDQTPKNEKCAVILTANTSAVNCAYFPSSS